MNDHETTMLYPLRSAITRAAEIVLFRCPQVLIVKSDEPCDVVFPDRFGMAMASIYGATEAAGGMK